MEKDIKVNAKVEKRLAYLGFEEKNLSLKNIPVYKIERRYFIHSNGTGIRVNVKEKTLTMLNQYGVGIETSDSLPSSYIKEKYLQ